MTDRYFIDTNIALYTIAQEFQGFEPPLFLRLQQNTMVFFLELTIIALLLTTSH